MMYAAKRWSLQPLKIQPANTEILIEPRSVSEFVKRGRCPNLSPPKIQILKTRISDTAA